MSPLYLIFRNNLMDDSFLEYYFKSGRWHKFMHQIGDTGARADRYAIRVNDFFEMPINAPSNSEQIKIGALMKNIESLLTLYQRRLDKLELLKHEYLKKMFANKESKPSVRFKGFTDEWEKQYLRNLGEIITGNTPSTNNLMYYAEEGLPWITPSDISNGKLKKSHKNLTDEGKQKAKIVPAQSILVTCIASIGKNYITQKESAFNQQINAIIPKNVETKFLFYRMYSVSRYMKKIAPAATMQIINKFEFENIKTYTVNDIREQNKIGLFLTNLDELSTLYQRKLDNLSKLKSVYLQKLFI